MLKFNSQRCIADFKSRLKNTLIDLQEEYANEIESGMQSQNGKNDVYIHAVNIFADILVADVVCGPCAIMDSFGTGSAMDPDNPFLDEYMNSESWNSYRGTDPTIRSRERGPYTNIFGETVYSKSNVGGIDLEKRGVILPSAPSKAIETALKWMIASDRIRKSIQIMIQNWDLSKYIIID